MIGRKVHTACGWVTAIIGDFDGKDRFRTDQIEVRNFLEIFKNFLGYFHNFLISQNNNCLLAKNIVNS
jgi:hypothetical protein